MTPEQLAKAFFESNRAVSFFNEEDGWDSITEDERLNFLDVAAHFLTLYTVTPIDPAKGCHHPLLEGKNMACYIDNKRTTDCTIARKLIKQEKTHNDCPHWREPDITP